MYPILFTIPWVNIPIFSYGVMLGLSLIVAWYYIMHMGAREGMSREIMGNCFLATAIAAMIGARLLYVLTNLGEFEGGRFFDYLNIRRGGLVAYGGFLGGFFGSWIYIAKKRIRLLAWADVVVPTLATGLGITRVGCLLYGCDFGKPTDLPWGIRFPNWEVRFPDLYQMMNGSGGCAKGVFHGAPAWVTQVNQGLIDRSAEASLPVHPTQIYEILDGWLIFGILMLVLRRRYFQGQLFVLFTMLYAVTRFGIEFLRGDAERGNVGFLSTSQFVAIVTFAAAAALYVFLHLKARRDPQAAMAVGPGAQSGQTAPSTEKKPWSRKRKRT